MVMLRWDHRIIITEYTKWKHEGWTIQKLGLLRIWLGGEVGDSMGLVRVLLAYR